METASPTWHKTWTRDGATGPRSIELYQTFNGPSGTSGGDEVRTVQVNGEDATLYRHDPTGDLVLVWTLGPDGLALVGNEADFSAAQLIDLAEAATRP